MKKRHLNEPRAFMKNLNWVMNMGLFFINGVYLEMQCLIHGFFYILFYSLNYSVFKEISLLFKIIPVMRNHSMHLEKWLHFIFSHSSPSVIINAWVQCVAIQVKFSFRVDVPLVKFIHLLTPQNVKSFIF